MPRLKSDENTKAFSMRLAESEYNAVAELAANNSLPFSNYVRMVIKHHLQEQEQKQTS